MSQLCITEMICNELCDRVEFDRHLVASDNKIQSAENLSNQLSQYEARFSLSEELVAHSQLPLSLIYNNQKALDDTKFTYAVS